MELENKKKIACYQGNVMAFKYQSTSCEEIEVEDYPEEWENEPIFTESQQYRFKVVDGVVIKKTEEELKSEPEYNQYQSRIRAEAYKLEADSIYLKAQELKHSGDEAGYNQKMTEWVNKKQDIRNQFPYYEG